MDAKTDIWMPLYIGDYLAATTHLSAEESGAYLHLLMHQWKNGSLPSDQESLRRIARVEKDAWSNAWSILQAFFEHSSSMPIQKRLESIREEWNGRKATAVAKAQAASAKRWSKHATSNAPSIPTSNAQAMPQTCPSPSPSPLLKQKPSRDKREADPRHKFFKEVLSQAWAAKNSSDMPWSAGEAKQMASLLSANPNLTEEDFRKLLRNRHKSQVNHSQRPRTWLENVTDYANGPLDKFGKPAETVIEVKPMITLLEKMRQQEAV